MLQRRHRYKYFLAMVTQSPPIPVHMSKQLIWWHVCVTAVSQSSLLKWRETCSATWLNKLPERVSSSNLKSESWTHEVPDCPLKPCVSPSLFSTQRKHNVHLINEEQGRKEAVHFLETELRIAQKVLSFLIPRGLSLRGSHTSISKW